MPTTIDSAGITFNDTTSLTSANIGTAQLVNGSVIASKLGTNEQKRICKAWVNFNGTTSPGTIRSSYNVSSVTKNGTGNYTVNFATPMADANYSVAAGGGNNLVYYGVISSSSINIISGYPSSLAGANATTDSSNMYVTVFGN